MGGDAGHAEPRAIEKVQDAARELEKTAAAAGLVRPHPRASIASGRRATVSRVGISPVGINRMITILGQTALVLLLTYFLLVNDELLKRKLVENIGPTLTRKKITVQILNDIGSQIERFLLVQILPVRSLR